MTSWEVYHCLVQFKKNKHKTTKSLPTCYHFLQFKRNRHTMTMRKEVHCHLMQFKKNKHKTTISLLAHHCLLQPKKTTSLLAHHCFLQPKKTTSLLARHCLLQPKKKNHKMMTSQKACCCLLQPKAKNHKTMMSREAHGCLLQLKKKTTIRWWASRLILTCRCLLQFKQKQNNTEDNDEPWGSSSSSVNIRNPNCFFSMPTHIQIQGWCFLPILVQKQVVVGNKVKDRHYNKLPNSLLMDHIFGMFSFLTSLPTSHFLNFL